MHALACCLVMLFTVACGASTPSAPPTLTPVSRTSTTAATHVGATAPMPVTAASAPTGLLFARVQYPDPGIRVIDTSTPTPPRVLPLGVPAPDWSTLYTASYDGAHTQVAALDPLTGAVRRTSLLDHSYQFQWDDGYGAANAGGVSPDGRWIALTGSREYHADGRVRSQFAVLDSAFTQPARTLALDGAYTFDAIANDGQTLYLIENLPAASVTATPAAGDTPRYRVVFMDLRYATAGPQVLVDKTTQGATMAGTRQSTVVMPDGRWLFSLYRNPKQPFIHALNLIDHFAVCIFLPASGGDLAPQEHWALTRTADATRLYAANGMTNTVVEIDAVSLSTLRTVVLTMDASHAANPLAAAVTWFAPWRVEAKGDLVPTGLAVTPDGSTLAMTGAQGVALIDTRDLHMRTRVLTDQHLGNIAVSLDGAQFYAVDTDAGALIALDPVSGAMRRSVPIGRSLWDFTILGVT